MSKCFRYLSVVLFFSLDVLLIQGQASDQGLRNITDRFSAFCKSVPYEEIYMHTDREIYISGEYLWLSIYLFDRQSSSLSSASSYVYIELLNPVNQPVSQLKIHLDNGAGGGGFTLPDSLRTGKYTLRAYSRWMKNFLPYGCFMKNITVCNLFSEKHYPVRDISKPTDDTSPVVEFYPEGGRIIGGCINKVGLKVSTKSGRVKGCKGIITDPSGDILTTINVDSTGIGSFEFTPAAGKNYLLKTENGKGIFYLPVIYETGYSLHVKKSDKSFLELDINSGQNSLSGNITWVYLTIQSNGKIHYSNKVLLTNKSTGINIPALTLNPGINQITVFSPLFKPVCERYVYIPFPPSENPILKTGERFERRKKIDLEIDLGNDYFPRGFSNYSLSVSASEANNGSYEISDYLTFGNEFIIPENLIERSLSLWKSSAKSIDDFLLTVKSNWIDWGKIMSDKPPVIKFNFEKDGQFLTGLIKNQNRTETNYKKLVILSVPGKIPVFKYAEIDSQNRFRFFIRDYENLQDMIIQPCDFNNSYSLIIESPFSEKYPESVVYKDTSVIFFNDETMKWSVNYQVDKIYGISSIGDTIKSKEVHLKPNRFYGKPDLDLKMKDYISLPVMQEVFFELIPGVIIRTNKSKYSFHILDPVTKRINDITPALFIDGVIIDDPSLIINLDPELVEEIDVIKSEYIIGYVKFSGIINVITKAGDFRNVPLPRNAVRYKFKAADHNFNFRLPDYSSDEKNNSRIPDFRNTLYWNSDIKPDKNGKILISIPASDFTSDYMINFQGATGRRLFSARKIISVE